MERLINKLKTIFILCLVFSCVVFFNTDYVQAREIGQADGSFSFSYVPYGTYTMKLDDKDIGTVTINSVDKQQDYTINGYQIAVVVKEANGEFARDKWIHVEKDEKKSMIMQLMTKDWHQLLLMNRALMRCAVMIMAIGFAMERLP